MRSPNVVFLVSCGFVLAAACGGSSSSKGGGNDGGGGSSGGSGSGGAGDDSGNTGSSSGGPLGDGGINWTCMSAADCTEGGAGQVCCLSLMSMATACQATCTGMGNYQQCASSDTECPSGLHCTPAPMGYQGHYCAPGGDGGTARTDSGGAETGTSDAGTD